MEQISRSVRATGAVLLQGDVRTPDVPRTASVDQLISHYFREGWHTRDLRVRGAAHLANGQAVITDQDVVTSEEMNREAFYNECLYPNGFKWFAGVGFRVGSALWALSIQRTMQEGPFEEEEKTLLARLSPQLTTAASLSMAIGQIAVSGLTNVLELVEQPALVLDRMGIVLEMNAAAAMLMSDEIRVSNRRLTVRDGVARAGLSELTDRLRAGSCLDQVYPRPILVRRDGRPAIMIRVLSLPASARGPFLGACVLLTLTDLTSRSTPTHQIIRQAFHLSNAEARLATLVAAGISPTSAADQIGIARETARNQLKAVFAKTDTHRQSELVALLSRLRR